MNYRYIVADQKHFVEWYSEDRRKVFMGTTKRSVMAKLKDWVWKNTTVPVWKI